MKRFAPLITLAFLCATAELLVRFEWVASFLLPTPSSVLAALVEDRAEFASAFFSTATASFSGLALSVLLGTLSAVLFSLSSFMRAAVFPYAIFFQTVPIIAIAPILVIWFGFGLPTVIISSFIVSIFPIIANTLLGLQSVDRDLSDLFTLYRASHFDRLVKLEIPSALPSVFSGVRIAAGLSVIGAVVGEFVAGGGLGSIVDAARTQNRMDKVFAAVLVSSLLGAALVSTINLLSRRILSHWHASERK